MTELHSRKSSLIPVTASLGFLFLLMSATAPTWAEDNKVTLKSDTGKYAARCNGCIPGGANPDSAFVHETDPKASWAQWKLEKRTSGNYTLQSDTGKYFALCSRCIPGSAEPDSVFVHETDPNARWAQWKLARQANGKYTLQSVETGKYAARCNGCIPGGAEPDSVFVHETDPKANWAQWSISKVPVTRIK
jgi:hypothetical protein